MANAGKQVTSAILPRARCATRLGSTLVCLKDQQNTGKGQIVGIARSLRSASTRMDDVIISVPAR
jgi:hypothetical protein